MIVAALGVVGIVGGVVAVANHGDHSDHSNHRNYPDSSLRDEIARLEAETVDFERSVDRFYSNNAKSVFSEFIDFVRSNPNLLKKVHEKLGSNWENADSLDTIKQNMKLISKLMSSELEREINLEKSRLNAIDQAIRKINYIKLVNKE